MKKTELEPRRKTTTRQTTPATHHIERHDDHEIDADAGARGGKLPVLLDKVPVEGGKLLHGDEAENHHGKHGRQNQRDLSVRRDEEVGSRMRGVSD